MAPPKLQPFHLAPNEDGSSVRIKVAQYYVNKKLKELESKNPKIKVDDWTLLHTLPELSAQDAEDPTGGTEELAGGAVEPPQLPPIFTNLPGEDHISWNDLLKFDRDRRTSTNRGGRPPTLPPWYRVAIIGAGVAGLRIAYLLQRQGIPYEILEASDRVGGRIFTYHFASKPPGNPQGRHDYYDVGAMRYPDNEANKPTIDLFKELGLQNQMIDFIFSRDNNIYDYNYIKSTAAIANSLGDTFDDKSFVPPEYLYKEYVDLSGKKVYGVNACTLQAQDPWRAALVNDFDKGWEELMEYDWASSKSYLNQVSKYPLSVVQWMETRNSGTGGYDVAFAEAILGSLEFNDPRGNKWYTLEGGSHIFIDKMLDKLTTKPLLNQRVTSVKQVYRSPYETFPNLPWNRRRPPPRFPFMEVKVEGKAQPQYFSHVVSTASFASLRTIDTEHVPMTYKQRQAIRSLHYAPAIKVAIKFKTRWWESPHLQQFGGSSFTDRQTRVVVYPSYGMGEEGPGVLLVPYSWYQDSSRYGALTRNPDWNEQRLNPDRVRPPSEQLLLQQIYKDLAALHGVTIDYLVGQTLDYHAFYWYQCPWTMGSFANFEPGQYSLLYPDIVEPAANGRFHFAGELASHHHAWVSGALDSAVRVVKEILYWDLPQKVPEFDGKYGRSKVFKDVESEEKYFVRGLFGKYLNEAGY